MSSALATSPASHSSPVVVIEPASGWSSLRLGELWEYRELLFFLTWRDVKVRYKQTVLGASWAILQPVLTMVVFSLFFGRLAKISSGDMPYPIFSFVGLTPWTFFSNGLTQASNSLVGNSNLLKKVYFPRLAAPVSSVIASLVDFALAFVVLLGMMLYYGYLPGFRALLLPVLVLVAFLSAVGVGLWLAALNVQFRDVRYTVPFLVQLWLFATPIAYPASLLAAKWRPLYAINPMVGVVEGFRWSLLDGKYPLLPTLIVSAASAFVLFVTGLIYFRRMERTFADVV
jgi:lipopolysaccharide transport system permease protein